jgi:hypothetical protein
MAETAVHVAAIFGMFGALRYYFRGREDVYVTSDVFLYYEEGNPAARRAPDILVAFGVPSQPERTSFFTWREGVVPQVLFEFSSESTVQDDLTVKRDLYGSLGVKEYFLFDPLGTSLNPRFQGYRLAEGEMVRLELEADSGLTSVEMGIRLVPEGLYLRAIDLATGERVPTQEELGERAEQEKQRADALAAEVERLRKMLEEKAAE